MGQKEKQGKRENVNVKQYVKHYTLQETAIKKLIQR